MTTLPDYEPYTFIRGIGSGSMGHVYLAQRKDTGQQVAVKVVYFADSDTAKENIEIEERGARIQQAIFETHVARVNRWLRIRNDLLIEMEYISGGDLSDAMRRMGAFAPERAARITVELCRMLEALNRLAPPVVHGDLKLKNVLLCRPPETGDHAIKVIDFGIAKQLMDREGTINAFQTVQYSSPERLTSNRMNAQSDLWAVGVMLYEMTAGVKPFTGGSAESVQQRVLDPRGPDPLPENCPIPLRAIVFKALSRRIEQRYENASAMALDLERFLRNEPVQAQIRPVEEQTRRSSSGGETTRATTSSAAKVAPRVVVHTGWRRYLPTAVVRRIALLVAAFGGTYLFAAWQHNVYRAGDQLRAGVESDSVDLDSAWNSYLKLKMGAHMPLLLHGLESSLKRKLLEAGSEPVVNYRNDVPGSWEANWSKAQTDFQRVLQMDPGDVTAQGELLICEGHLARIRARQRRNHKIYYDWGLLQTAVDDFQRASHAMPNSADPYLGLARIYYYDEKDYARGADMLNEAAKRGHPMGRREKLQQADALRARAIRDMEQADQFSDMPDRQRQYLENARDDFRSAVSLYDQLVDYDPSSSKQIKDSLHRLQSIETRLQQGNGTATP